MIENTGTHEKLRFCGEIVAAYTNRSLQRTQAAIELYLPEVISRWMSLKAVQEKKNKDCGHLFNPLALIDIGETTHSLLLGDLLNPNGSHGQGRILLHAFLQHINVPNPKDGNWMISIEKEGRVDICLWRKSPASVILIENKSNGAVDQPNQLYRYWHEKIQKPYPLLDYSISENKQSFQIIYLPPTAGKHPTRHSLQRPDYLNASRLPKTLNEAGVTIKVLTFRDHITAWLGYCDQLIPSSNTRLRTHLQFYKELWS